MPKPGIKIRTWQYALNLSNKPQCLVLVQYLNQRPFNPKAINSQKNDGRVDIRHKTTIGGHYAVFITIEHQLALHCTALHH